MVDLAQSRREATSEGTTGLNINMIASFVSSMGYALCRKSTRSSAISLGNGGRDINGDAPSSYRWNSAAASHGHLEGVNGCIASYSQVGKLPRHAFIYASSVMPLLITTSPSFIGMALNSSHNPEYILSCSCTDLGSVRFIAHAA